MHGRRILCWRRRWSPSSSLAPRGRWAAISLASAALLASLGLVGHAAMQTGAEGVLHRLNHAVHLLAAGAWLGGLIAFAMCLQAYDRDDLRRDAVQAMMRFSVLGPARRRGDHSHRPRQHRADVRRPPIPPTTPYRALLLAKLGIVGIMIALAVFNRFVLAPQLKSSPGALAALRLTSIAEIALGSLVVALVSVFALLDPA